MLYAAIEAYCIGLDFCWSPLFLTSLIGSINAIHWGLYSRLDYANPSEGIWDELLYQYLFCL